MDVDSGRQSTQSSNMLLRDFFRRSYIIWPQVYARGVFTGDPLHRGIFWIVVANKLRECFDGAAGTRTSQTKQAKEKLFTICRDTVATCFSSLPWLSGIMLLVVLQWHSE